MRAFGRLLQHVGLIVPPVTIVMQLSGTIKPGQMLVTLVASVCIFYVGRLLEAYGQG